MATRAVVFDLYETLVSEATARVRRASSLAALLNLDEAAFKREWRVKRAEVLLGHCTFKQALAEIGQTPGSGIDQAVLEQLQSERVAEKTAILANVESEILYTLAELQQNGLKLALISNCLAEDVAGWKLGFIKPDRLIYRLTCDALDVDSFVSKWPGSTTAPEEQRLRHIREVLNHIAAA